MHLCYAYESPDLCYSTVRISLNLHDCNVACGSVKDAIEYSIDLYFISTLLLYIIDGDTVGIMGQDQLRQQLAASQVEPLTAPRTRSHGIRGSKHGHRSNE